MDNIWEKIGGIVADSDYPKNDETEMNDELVNGVVNSDFISENDSEGTSAKPIKVEQSQRCTDSNEKDKHLRCIAVEQYIIPRKKICESELLLLIKEDSREYQHDILPNIIKSFRREQSKCCFTYNKPYLVHNKHLEQLYLDKKKEFRQSGYTDKEVKEIYGYLLVEEEQDVESLCREGPVIGNMKNSCLGHPEMGVQLCKHADLIKPGNNLQEYNGYLIIFKVMKGRVKQVVENHTCIPLEPTPNYDCHIAVTSDQNSTTNQTALFNSSQIYIYEYGEENVEQHPRQVIPFAVVSLTFKPKPVRQKKVTKSSGKNQRQISPPRPTAPTKDEEEFIVWNGPLTIKGLYACYVNMKSSASWFKPAKLGKGINITHKLDAKRAKQKYLRSIGKLRRNIEDLWGNYYVNVCELHPSKPEGRSHFEKMMNYLGKHDCVAVQKLEKDVILLLLTQGELSYQLGLTQPHQYPVVLYCLFLSKNSRRKRSSGDESEDYLGKKNDRDEHKDNISEKKDNSHNTHTDVEHQNSKMALDTKCLVKMTEIKSVLDSVVDVRRHDDDMELCDTEDSNIDVLPPLTRLPVHDLQGVITGDSPTRSRVTCLDKVLFESPNSISRKINMQESPKLDRISSKVPAEVLKLPPDIPYKTVTKDNYLMIQDLDTLGRTSDVCVMTARWDGKKPSVVKSSPKHEGKMTPSHIVSPSTPGTPTLDENRMMHYYTSPFQNSPHSVLFSSANSSRNLFTNQTREYLTENLTNDSNNTGQRPLRIGNHGEPNVMYDPTNKVMQSCSLLQNQSCRPQPDCEIRTLPQLPTGTPPPLPLDCEKEPLPPLPADPPPEEPPLPLLDSHQLHRVTLEPLLPLPADPPSEELTPSKLSPQKVSSLLSTSYGQLEQTKIAAIPLPQTLPLDLSPQSNTSDFIHSPQICQQRLLDDQQMKMPKSTSTDTSKAHPSIIISSSLVSPLPLNTPALSTTCMATSSPVTEPVVSMTSSYQQGTLSETQNSHSPQTIGQSNSPLKFKTSLTPPGFVKSPSQETSPQQTSVYQLAFQAVMTRSDMSVNSSQNYVHKHSPQPLMSCSPYRLHSPGVPCSQNFRGYPLLRPGQMLPYVVHSTPPMFVNTSPFTQWSPPFQPLNRPMVCHRSPYRSNFNPVNPGYPVNPAPIVNNDINQTQQANYHAIDQLSKVVDIVHQQQTNVHVQMNLNKEQHITGIVENDSDLGQDVTGQRSNITQTMLHQSVRSDPVELRTVKPLVPYTDIENNKTITTSLAPYTDVVEKTQPPTKLMPFVEVSKSTIKSHEAVIQTQKLLQETSVTHNKTTLNNYSKEFSKITENQRGHQSTTEGENGLDRFDTGYVASPPISSILQSTKVKEDFRLQEKAHEIRQILTTSPKVIFKTQARVDFSDELKEETSDDTIDNIIQFLDFESKKSTDSYSRKHETKTVEIRIDNSYPGGKATTRKSDDGMEKRMSSETNNTPTKDAKQMYKYLDANLMDSPSRKVRTVSNKDVENMRRILNETLEKTSPKKRASVNSPISMVKSGERKLGSNTTDTSIRTSLKHPLGDNSVNEFVASKKIKLEVEENNFSNSSDQPSSPVIGIIESPSPIKIVKTVVGYRVEKLCKTKLIVESDESIKCESEQSLKSYGEKQCENKSEMSIDDEKLAQSLEHEACKEVLDKSVDQDKTISMEKTKKVKEEPTFYTESDKEKSVADIVQRNNSDKKETELKDKSEIRSLMKNEKQGDKSDCELKKLCNKIAPTGTALISEIQSGKPKSDVENIANPQENKTTHKSECMSTGLKPCESISQEKLQSETKVAENIQERSKVQFNERKDTSRKLGCGLKSKCGKNFKSSLKRTPGKSEFKEKLKNASSKAVVKQKSKSVKFSTPEPDIQSLEKALSCGQKNVENSKSNTVIDEKSRSKTEKKSESKEDSRTVDKASINKQDLELKENIKTDSMAKDNKNKNVIGNHNVKERNKIDIKINMNSKTLMSDKISTSERLKGDSKIDKRVKSGTNKNEKNLKSSASITKGGKFDIRRDNSKRSSVSNEKFNKNNSKNSARVSKSSEKSRIDNKSTSKCSDRTSSKSDKDSSKQKGSSRLEDKGVSHSKSQIKNKDAKKTSHWDMVMKSLEADTANRNSRSGKRKDSESETDSRSRTGSPTIMHAKKSKVKHSSPVKRSATPKKGTVGKVSNSPNKPISVYECGIPRQEIEGFKIPRISDKAKSDQKLSGKLSSKTKDESSKLIKSNKKDNSNRLEQDSFRSESNEDEESSEKYEKGDEKDQSKMSDNENKSKRDEKKETINEVVRRRPPVPMSKNVGDIMSFIQSNVRRDRERKDDEMMSEYIPPDYVSDVQSEVPEENSSDTTQDLLAVMNGDVSLEIVDEVGTDTESLKDNSSLNISDDYAKDLNCAIPVYGSRTKHLSGDSRKSVITTSSPNIDSTETQVESISDNSKVDKIQSFLPDSVRSNKTNKEKDLNDNIVPVTSQGSSTVFTDSHVKTFPSTSIGIVQPMVVIDPLDLEEFIPTVDRKVEEVKRGQQMRITVKNDIPLHKTVVGYSQVELVRTCLHGKLDDMKILTSQEVTVHKSVSFTLHKLNISSSVQRVVDENEVSPLIELKNTKETIEEENIIPGIEDMNLLEEAIHNSFSEEDLEELHIPDGIKQAESITSLESKESGERGSKVTEVKKVQISPIRGPEKDVNKSKGKLKDESKENSKRGPVRSSSAKTHRQDRQHHPYIRKEKQYKSGWSFDINYTLQELMQNLTTTSFKDHRKKLTPRVNKPRFCNYRFRRSAIPEFLPDEREDNDLTEEAIPDFDERKKRAELLDTWTSTFGEDEPFTAEQTVYDRDAEPPREDSKAKRVKCVK